MRHRKKSVKLGRTSQHRDSMLANMAGSLIKHNRIKTTLSKAKALRPVAEKLVTLGKKGGLHQRRLALAQLGDDTVVKKLFTDIAPRFKERAGGYTRILKLGPRSSDAASMAFIEWVDAQVVEAAPVAETEAKPAKAKKATKAKAAEKEEASE